MTIRGSSVALILTVLLLITLSVQPKTTLAEDGDFKVTLLGTGTPPPLMNRFGPATLVEAGGKMFLFDAGRGATQQMWQLKKPFGKLEALILTHLHSDHVVGVPDVWLTGWLRGPYGRRDDPLRVIGPKGTENLMKHLQLAYAWDVDTRVIDQKMSRDAAAAVAEDVEPGVVYDQDGVTITAFANNHGELINPSFGYRIDYDGRAVVLSGDSKKVQSVIDVAKGVDLLVHSIGAAKKELLESAPIWRLIMAHHIQPEEAGEVFSEASPKLAVFTHVVSLTNGKIPPVGPDEIMERTRTTYGGPLVMGQDLMTITVDKDEVTAEPWKQP
ncbi:MAG: MBL fold metallo-hydrolase [Geminicoccaceae bacterium]